jgi:hypothetical protein
MKRLSIKAILSGKEGTMKLTPPSHLAQRNPLPYLIQTKTKQHQRREANQRPIYTRSQLSRSSANQQDSG